MRNGLLHWFQPHPTLSLPKWNLSANGIHESMKVGMKNNNKENLLPFYPLIDSTVWISRWNERIFERLYVAVLSPLSLRISGTWHWLQFSDYGRRKASTRKSKPPTWNILPLLIKAPCMHHHQQSAPRIIVCHLWAYMQAKERNKCNVLHFLASEICHDNDNSTIPPLKSSPTLSNTFT